MIANDRWPVNRKKLEGPVIGSWSRIGINVTILPGVRIGTGAMIGGGAVVTRDVPRWAVVIGVPGRVVGTVPQTKRRLR